MALGFRHELVEAELDRLAWMPRPEIVLNMNFELGSVLTVHTVADALTRGGDVLLDGCRCSVRRAHSCGPWWPARGPVNRLLIDRDFEAGR